MVETPGSFTAWHIVAAVLFIVLGLFAIIEPGVAALGIALLFGWLLILGGVAHLIASFRGGGTRRILLQILAAIVFLVGGAYILTHPLLAVGTLTALLGVVILATGVFEIIIYSRLGREHRSGWVLFNGIAALVLGALILAHWPSSSVWALGTLVGLNLLFTGVTRLMFGLAARGLIVA